MKKSIMNKFKEKRNDYLVYTGLTTLYAVGFVKLWLHWLSLS